MKTNYELRKDFSIFESENIAYLDNAATSQKPKCVLEDIEKFYKKFNANPHRGAYGLSIKATEVLNKSRHKVAQFLNAKFDEEIIFTKNATESLNLLAYSFGMDNVKSGDEIVLSIMEHHSMIVPFQKVAQTKNAKLKYMYLDSDYQIDDKEIESKITGNTKIVGIVSVSNVLGTITNYKKIIKKAHSVGAVVIVDISQSIAHEPFDVQDTDADFVVFSAHKMYAPLGTGVLYGKKELLEKMSPFLMGGDMIEYVYEQSTSFAPLPNKFEAGTQNVAGIYGLCSAIEYLQNISYETINKIESSLTKYAIKKLKELPFIKLYCTDNLSQHEAVVSFNIDGVHPHDVASILDMQGVCIRAGNHCAQPLLRYLGVDSTCRISISFYNTKEDIDRLIEALKKVYEMFIKFKNKQK